MAFTFSLSLGWLVVLVFSILLFFGVMYICQAQGLNDGSDTYGIAGLFSVVFYLLFWAVPSLLVVIIKLLFFA